MKEIKVKEINNGQRLDSYLAKTFPEYSRSYFSSLIQSGLVKRDGRNVKPSSKIYSGEKIEITFSEKPAMSLSAERIPLNIIFENSDVIVINKQPGLVVHPAAGNFGGTLVNALLSHFPPISEAISDNDHLVAKTRPGLVHRLDKDTSGVLIVAKNVTSMHFLTKQISSRNVKKIYWAINYGWPKKEKGTLINFIGRHPKNRKVIAEIGQEKGREAISEYRVLKYFETSDKQKISLIEFNIKTGRTHQIRVQSKIFGHPILGDEIYHSKESAKISKWLGPTRQMLHAKALEIIIPGEATPRHFEAPLPSDFLNILSKLKESV